MSSEVINEVVAGRPLEELDALIAAATAQKEIAKVEAVAEFEALVESIKAKAVSLGVNVKSYFIEKKEVADKYQNPANPDEKWNGRGPNPTWMKALLEGVDKSQWKAEKAKYLIPA